MVRKMLSEGAEWEDHTTHEYGEPDAYGHRKKASVAESLADEIKRRAGGRRFLPTTCVRATPT
jgi:hypothetical protein